ncbi:MOT12-like protein [Mya arenaria]|uniref:MOT12-like protein n=1 Tax=Mya arenaria TaxID=6604 RepID=A0ABY7FCZ0_MYAAR|nr:MOT12-like protein [Mya arenaria]WAR20077.1 MOT12-like protein [Mya arenaria]
MAIDKSLIISNSEIADVAEKPQVSHPGSDKPVETTTSTIDSNSSTKEVDEDKTAGLPIDRGWAWVVLLAAGFYLMLFGGIRKNFGIFFVEIQSRFQSSIGTALVHPPVIAIIGEYFHKRRGFAMAVAMSGASFGGLIFAPIMSALFEQLGYTGTLMIVAGMTLNFCVAGSLMRPIKSFERTSNGDGSEIEMETLISKSNGVKPHMNSTDEIIAQLVIEQENNHIRMLPAKAVLQLKQSENPHTKLVRSESLEPVKDRNKMKPAESPLLPRARAWSTGTRRQRTVSVQSEVSAAPSHKALSPLNSLVETLSHSRIAIYSSMAEGLYGSVLDIQEIGVDKRTANGHAYVVPKQSICDKLRSSFDFGIFRSTVFPLFLCMAALLSSISILMPSFLPPHAKDLGLLPEQRGLLLSVTPAGNQ